jgi:hypothetical protein
MKCQFFLYLLRLGDEAVAAQAAFIAGNGGQRRGAATPVGDSATPPTQAEAAQIAVAEVIVEAAQSSKQSK